MLFFSLELPDTIAYKCSTLLLILIFYLLMLAQLMNKMLIEQLQLLIKLSGWRLVQLQLSMLAGIDTGFV